MSSFLNNSVRACPIKLKLGMLDHMSNASQNTVFKISAVDVLLTKYYKSICCSKPGECKKKKKKTNFWTLLQLKITETYTNEDILHHKRIQTYNTFTHRINNYQISLMLYIVAAIIITFIMNTTFSLLFLLPFSLPQHQLF